MTDPLVSALIVAAGKGVRMNASARKQYLLLGGAPIITRTVRVFSDCPFIRAIYIAVPPADVDYCRGLFGRYPIKAEWRVVPGGESRQKSVYRGLTAMEKNMSPNDLVVIHDGVRPLVTQSQIESCVVSAEKCGASILAIPAQDTVKQVENDSDRISGTLPRNSIWLAQTPQVFKYGIIREAHEHAVKNGISGTDDAALVEMMSGQVRVVVGSRTNIKITEPEDLAYAESLLGLKQ